jgi:small subunit ribosomal protein S6
MREYELTVVYDLAVQEAGGPDASVEQLTNLVQARGGKVLRVDHWGRRRMAYPINKAIDGDYVVSRVELEPTAVTPLEAALGIDERVYRHLIVRADELPVPPPPREPRREPTAAATGPAEAAAPVVPPEGGATTPAAAEAAEAAVEEAPETPPAEETAAAVIDPVTSIEAAPVADATGEPEVPATTSEAEEMGEAEASPEPVAAEDEDTGEGKAPASGTIATDESAN